MTARAELPTRRLNTTLVMDWAGIRWLVTLGWDIRGKVAEIFCDGVDEIGNPPQFALTPHQRANAHDVCILISHLLQTGRDVGELYERLAPPPTVQPMAILTLPCALLKLAVEDQAKHGVGVVEAYEIAARGDPRSTIRNEGA